MSMKGKKWIPLGIDRRHVTWSVETFRSHELPGSATAVPLAARRRRWAASRDWGRGEAARRQLDVERAVGTLITRLRYGRGGKVVQEGRKGTYSASSRRGVGVAASRYDGGAGETRPGRSREGRFERSETGPNRKGKNAVSRRGAGTSTRSSPSHATGSVTSCGTFRRTLYPAQAPPQRSFRPGERLLAPCGSPNLPEDRHR